MTLEQLRKALKDKITALTELETKALADASTDDDVNALEKATQDIEALERKIKALEASEGRRAKAAKSVDTEIEGDSGDADEEEELQPAKVKKDLKSDEKIGLVMLGMVKAARDDGYAGQRQTYKAIEDLGYGQFAKQFDLAKKKSLRSDVASQGGVLLPEDMANEMIPLLYPNTTFMQGGARRIVMPNGTFKQPKGATGASAAYRGEKRAMAVSHATASEINMSAKLLAGVTTITDQLLRYSLIDAAAWAKDDLSTAMGTTFDSAAYFGSGTAYTPMGLLNASGIFSAVATGGVAPSVAQIEADCKKLELSMINVNLPMTGAKWVLAPRILLYMQDLRDGNGNRLFPELQGTSPTFRGKPVLSTTQFPINGGAGTDESTIALIAFGHVMYGDTLAMQFKITRDATIVNGAETINTWQQGVMGMAFEWEHDVGSRYVEAVAKLTAVRWGA